MFKLGNEKQALLNTMDRFGQMLGREQRNILNLLYQFQYALTGDITTPIEILFSDSVRNSPNKAKLVSAWMKLFLGERKDSLSDIARRYDPLLSSAA